MLINLLVVNCSRNLLKKTVVNLIEFAIIVGIAYGISTLAIPARSYVGDWIGLVQVAIMFVFVGFYYGYLRIKLDISTKLRLFT